MPLFSQRTAEKMGATAGFHADQLDLPVRREAQQLQSRELLAHHKFAAQVETNQMKHCLAKVDTDRVLFHGVPPPCALILSRWLGKGGGPSHLVIGSSSRFVSTNALSRTDLCPCLPVPPVRAVNRPRGDCAWLPTKFHAPWAKSSISDADMRRLLE
jgi:hypothetical protein